MKTLSAGQLAEHARKAPKHELARPNRPGRLAEVDHAKGLAIALVVWGHVAGATIPLSPTWFYISVAVIYSFHMPFFMYLSGYVFFAIGAHERFLRQYSKCTAQRFNRLMVPFVGFSTIVVFGKYFASAFGPVDRDVKSISSGIYDVITNSPNNPCVAVWYLLCLFVYSVLSPLLWRAGRNSMALILFLGCAGWIFQLPREFYVDRIAQFLIFFGIGGFVAAHREMILPLMKRTFGVTFAAFTILCYVMLDQRYAMLVCGLAAIPALHGMFLQNFWNKDRFFLMLGNYSLTIYLLNTIAIGIFKLIYLPHFSYTGGNFYIFLAEINVFGLFAPIIFLKGLESLPGSRSLARYLR